MTLNQLKNTVDNFGNTEKMPVLFLGHGSPMNAIEENEFVGNFRKLGQQLPVPNAILCVSAHWETRGTHVTAMENPETIHDFGGFPRELFEVQYPAPGNPELARDTKNLIKSTDVVLSDKWGLDHGAWSVILHLFPKANIPVVQLSLDFEISPEKHYAIGKELNALRSKGVLIIGSGNIVHNLRKIVWSRMDDDNFGLDWAVEANEKMKDFIRNNDHQSLIDFRKQGPAFDLAIPTPEHYLPLLYTMGLKDKDEPVNIFNDKAVGGSLTMTSVLIGNLN